MNKPEIVVVSLRNGDSALFLNGQVIYSVKANNKGDPDSPLDLGMKMATALGITPHAVEMSAPKDVDWNWQDVYELIPTFDSDTDPATNAIPVSHWNSTQYGAEVEPSSTYAMRLCDRRATHGQLFIDVQPDSGHTDDLGLGVVIEINNTPGMDHSHVPCAHINFGNGALGFSIFQDGLDNLVLRPETGVQIMSGAILPNGEHAYSVRGE